IEGQSILREDRITEFLELLENFMVQTRIVMIGPAQHHDADAVFALELIQNLAGAVADRKSTRLNQSRQYLVCRLLLEKKKKIKKRRILLKKKKTREHKTLSEVKDI